MRIYVDADACPVVKETEQVAKKYGIAVTLLCDTNHVLQSTYSEVRGNRCRSGCGGPCSGQSVSDR